MKGCDFFAPRSAMSRATVASLIVFSLVVASACAPTARYTQGPALYPPDLAASELDQARAAGRVTNLGHFDTSAMGCGNYGSAAVDQNLIGPAIQKQLDKMGANAAENITVSEPPENFLSGWLVAPALAGCVGWNVSGDALKVDRNQQGRSAI